MSSGGNPSMGFGDFAKVLEGWTRSIKDNATVDAGATDTRFPVTNSNYILNQFDGYYLVFVTGALTGYHFLITNTETNAVNVVSRGVTPATTDIFCIYNPEEFIAQDIEEIKEALTDSTIEVIADNDDISGGETFYNDFEHKWRNTTIYVRTTSAIDITLEFAPEDGGLVDFYEPEESPLIFSAAGTNIYEVNFVWKGIRVTGSNANPVDIKIKGLV